MDSLKISASLPLYHKHKRQQYQQQQFQQQQQYQQQQQKPNKQSRQFSKFVGKDQEEEFVIENNSGEIECHNSV